MKRDFLSVESWSDAEVDGLLALAARVKRGEVSGGLERRVAAMAKDAELPAEKIRDKLREKFTYAYRTFLNSVLVTPSNGSQKEKPTRRVLIVPRYADASARDLEARVESGYREAYGEELEIVFVEAEALAHGNGSLRCIVCPIPAD